MRPFVHWATVAFALAPAVITSTAFAQDTQAPTHSPLQALSASVEALTSRVSLSVVQEGNNGTAFSTTRANS